MPCMRYSRVAESSNKEKHVKESIKNKIGIFLNESMFLGMFSFPAKIIQETESFGLKSSNSRSLLNLTHLLF